MKPSRVATFDKQIAVLNAAVQRLTNERELAALALIEAPGSKEPLASMHNADEQLTKAKRELEHLQAARNAAARIDAVDDRAARLAELRSMRDAALKIAKKDRVALAAQLEELIGRAKPLLDKWATITAECRTLSSCIGVEAMGATEWVRRSDNVMDAATSEIGPGEALGGALVAAGLGITGPRCDAMRNIGHASRASIADATAMDGDRLETRLDDLIRQVEREHYGADEAVRVESERRMHRLGASLTKEQLAVAPLPKKD